MFYGGKGTAILSDKQVFPHLFPFFGIFFVFTTETRYGDCAGNVRVRVKGSSINCFVVIFGILDSRYLVGAKEHSGSLQIFDFKGESAGIVTE